MPELPEVETVVNGLRPRLENNIFKKVQVYFPKLRLVIPEDLDKKLIGRKIVAVKRLAKYIIIALDNGKYLVIHLGMSGKIILDPERMLSKHDHVVFSFQDGTKVTYNDPRRFGLITIVDSLQAKIFKNMGVEPLSSHFSAQYLLQIFVKRTIAIKLAIMDNSIVVGVGNIYACESLFQAGILPTRPANSLSELELQHLCVAIKEILQLAINAGGSSLRDYVDIDGKLGYFQNSHFVYGREGKQCKQCDALIKRIIQGGRSSFYCPHCQH